MEVGIQQLRGTGMLEWVCLLSPVSQSGSVHRHTFHQHIENYILEKNIKYLKASMFTLLARPHLARETEPSQ